MVATKSLFTPGDKVFVRCVTHYYTGKVAESSPAGFLTLDDAAWIADTGRFSKALTDGTLNEVEPFPSSVTINLGAIVDISPWNHDLPRTVK